MDYESTRRIVSLIDAMVDLKIISYGESLLIKYMCAFMM